MEEVVVCCQEAKEFVVVSEQLDAQAHVDLSVSPVSEVSVDSRDQLDQ